MSSSKLVSVFSSQLDKFSNDLRKILKGDGDAMSMLDLLDGVNSATPGTIASFFKSEVSSV